VTSRVAKFLIFAFFVQLGLLGYVYQVQQESNRADASAKVELRRAARADCARDKTDRVDIARFQRTHAEYIKVVTKSSLSPTVRKKAGESLVVFAETASALERRAKVNCKE